ncbi:U4/U6 small nuclear ribonucleoprotein Prp4 [Pelomyxa schiedti]|nr:U4/U6 small nuclear ribonucleoprotein Prp4 [Pelomyxa schiedti]
MQLVPAPTLAPVVINVEPRDKKDDSTMEDEVGFSLHTLQAREKHREILTRMEQKWRARQIAIPTNDKLVMMRLRELKEPIMLFGEYPGDRRERLRDVLARLGSDQGMPSIAKAQLRDSDRSEEGELYYTEGTESLKKIRQWIAYHSLQYARKRVLDSQRLHDNEPALAQWEHAMTLVWDRVKKWGNISSQVGDERPLSGCAFSPDSSIVATCSWSGMAKLWSVKTCETLISLKGSNERIQGLAFHPQSCLSQDPASLNLATCGADSDVRLWSLESTSSIATLHGHADRVNRVAFHPCGKLLASTSNDATWRLWDLDTGCCVLEQEGHSRPVYGIGFQVDGSLVATCGVDAHVRVWDLRSGACISVLEGHVKQALALDWSPNGYVFATSSDDNTVRLWDLRKRKSVAVIPAHNTLISCVKFEKQNGDFLVSGSFDNSCKLWSVKRSQWSLLSCLTGHESKIISLDISHDTTKLITASYDRTWKLWAEEEVDPERRAQQLRQQAENAAQHSASTPPPESPTEGADPDSSSSSDSDMEL